MHAAAAIRWIDFRFRCIRHRVKFCHTHPIPYSHVDVPGRTPPTLRLSAPRRIGDKSAIHALRHYFT